MEIGDRVKIKFGGGHIGVITDVKPLPVFQVAYPVDGKPASGMFSGAELELTKEEPTEREFRGFGVRPEADGEDEADLDD